MQSVKVYFYIISYRKVDNKTHKCTINVQ